MEKASKKYFYNFGYKNYGPFLLEFSRWLNSEINNLKINKVFFLSRDGYIFKNAFDIIKDDNVKTTYMYASRRSICVPALNKLDNLAELLDIVKLPKEFTIVELLEKLGINNDLSIEKLKKININGTDILINDNLSSNNTMKNLYECLKQDIKTNSIEEHKHLMHYLDNINFDGRIAVVDIGWYGSMQKSLQILKPTTKQYGFYVGIKQDSSYDKEYNGLLFNSLDLTNAELINSFRMLFEFITLADHGSVKRFNGTKSIVDFYPYEYNDEFLECIKVIQESAIKFVEDNKNNKEFEFDLYKFSKPFIKPTFKDIKYFGRIPYFDNRIGYMAKPRSLIYYLTHSKTMIKDLKIAGWKIGFMKKVFKIPLPYYRINLKLRKKYAVKEK